MRTFLSLLCAALLAAGEPITTWVGNTHAGAGENGHGAWVQNGVDEIEVSPEGTVLAGASWDEAGRCLGLYRDGTVNSRIVAQYDMRGGHKAWGWGTANQAVAIDCERFYAINSMGDLMRWTWKPGDLDSHRFDSQALGTAKGTIGLAARGGVLVLVLPDGRIEVRAARHAHPPFVDGALPATQTAIATSSITAVVTGKPDQRIALDA